MGSLGEVFGLIFTCDSCKFTQVLDVLEYELHLINAKKIGNVDNCEYWKIYIGGMMNDGLRE